MTTRLIDALAQMLGDDGDPVAGAQLRFLIAGSTGTTAYQDTFSDINLANANPNPLPLEAGGRVPNVWVPPLYYRVRYEDGAGVLIKEADYVGGPEAAGQFGAWNNDEVYTIDRIVYFNGKFYRSTENGNQGNEPDSSAEWVELDIPEKYSATVTYGQYKLVYDAGILYVSTQPANTGNTPATSPNWWQRVNNIPVWGNATTYKQYDRAVGSDGDIYISQQTPNLNHDPVGDSGEWWRPFWHSDKSNNALTLSGGGNLSAYRINILTDSSTYTFPAANSVPSGALLIVIKPDQYRTAQPTMQRAGSDLIRNVSGADTSYKLDYGYYTVRVFKSNGSNEWSY